MAVTATAMRQILIDYARGRARAKRGGGAAAAPLDDAHAAVVSEAERLLDIDRALQQLAAFDARLVQVVECRYFAGYTDQETADALGLSLRTAQREWLRARAWLRQALSA